MWYFSPSIGVAIASKLLFLHWFYQNCIMSKFALIIVWLCLAFFPCMAKEGNFVLVIDPGHGGKDVGARGAKVYEKEINLEVALKFGELVETRMKNVEVVYTRRCDKFVPLLERANIANEAKGDLFVSIHTNSLAERNKKRKTTKGTSTYTLGLHRSEDNLEVMMRENSVITLEENYAAVYGITDPESAESYIFNEIMQNHYMEQSVDFASALQRQFVKTAGRTDWGVRQAGFLVLRETSMPSVLIELDFICNPVQENFLSSEDGQKKMAESMYAALEEYMKALEQEQNGQAATTVAVTNVSSSESASQHSHKPSPASADANSSVVYEVQILAGTSKLESNSREFKGLKGVKRYKDGRIYKYTYGASSTFSGAKDILRQVKSKFKDAFIVTVCNGKIE